MKYSIASLFAFLLPVAAARSSMPDNYSGKYILETHNGWERRDNIELVVSQNSLHSYALSLSHVNTMMYEMDLISINDVDDGYFIEMESLGTTYVWTNEKDSWLEETLNSVMGSMDEVFVPQKGELVFNSKKDGSQLIFKKEADDRENSADVPAKLQQAFADFLAKEGGVPADLVDEVIPTLRLNKNGSWNWNRMVDDPSYDGPTSQPINKFYWKWLGTSGSRLRVTNFESTPAGDRQKTVVLRA